MNNTRVVPARLFATKTGGAKIEIMIERCLDDDQALAMIKANKAPKIGSVVVLKNGVNVKVLDKCETFYVLVFETHSLIDLLNDIGHVPLPPYIKRTDDKDDFNRYQTVYAKFDGAVAVPTAGLHFDDELLLLLKQQGINHAFVTLHVGAGTFQLVKTEKIQDYVMHHEYFEIDQTTVDKIYKTKKNGGRVIAVGTTTVRSLESAMKNGQLRAIQEQTDIFIYPGYQFKVVDIMITNFHLPKTSLLMLVSAFVGHLRMTDIYQHAIKQKYRFFSYGDAMLLTRQSSLLLS